MIAYITVSIVAIGIFLMARTSKVPPAWPAAIAFAVGLIGIPVARHSHNLDTQLLAGRVVDKDVDTHICSHTYRCRCVKVGKTESCSTCRRHTLDFDYTVKVSGGAGHVSDSCGDCGPPTWWSRTNVGDPVAVPSTYQNYLFADEKNLLVPPLPVGVEGRVLQRELLVDTVDRIHPNPLIVDGVTPPAGLADAIRAWNADFGGAKQAYVTVVITNNRNPEYATLLAHHWKLGPKNGLTFVVGATPESTVEWARLVSFSADTSLHRVTRDELVGAELTGFMEAISPHIMALHNRDSMKSIEYLEKNTPIGWAASLAIAIAQIFAAGAVVAAINHLENATNHRRSWSHK